MSEFRFKILDLQITKFDAVGVIAEIIRLELKEDLVAHNKELLLYATLFFKTESI